MVVNEMAKYLASTENTFKDRETGQDVTFYKVHVIPTSDNLPLELTCSKEVFYSCQNLKAYDDVLLVCEIKERRGYINVRCTAVAVDGPTIEY